MNDQRTTDNIIDSGQLNVFVRDVDLGYTVRSGLNVAQVTDVTHFGSGSTVGLALWVEVGSGRDAAVGVVAELVNVETVRTGLESGNLAGHLHGSGGGLCVNNKRVCIVDNVFVTKYIQQ